MSKSSKSDDKKKKQKLLIEYLLSTPEAFIISKPVLKPEYFDKEFYDVIDFMLLHHNAYKLLPSIEMINAETRVSMDIKTDGAVRLDWILNELEAHCRQQATVIAITESSEHIDSGNFAAIIDPIKEAVSLSLHRDLGINYFEDPLARLKSMIQLNMEPTGFIDIDNTLFGGTMPGGLNIVSANSGGHKSWFLLNIAKNYIERNKNVVYITLELSELFISKRADQLIAKFSAQDIMKNMEEVDARVRSYGENAGTFIVKYFPAQTKVNEVESFIYELELKLGKKLDLIVVDYLDLLAPNDDRININDYFAKDKAVSENLRSIMMDKNNNYQCWTASQLNREAIKDGKNNIDHDQSHIAGGISKINTCDNLLTLYIDNALEEHGLIKVQFLKTRTSSGVGKTVFLGIDTILRQMYNASEEQKESFINKGRKPNGVFKDRSARTSTRQTGKNALVEASERLKQLKKDEELITK